MERQNDLCDPAFPFFHEMLSATTSGAFASQPMATSKTLPLVALVFSLLLNMAPAPRPGFTETHAMLQVQDESTSRYSVHAGGHFSRDHLRAKLEEQDQHQGLSQHFTRSFGVDDAQASWAKALSVLELKDANAEPLAPAPAEAIQPDAAPAPGPQEVIEKTGAPPAPAANTTGATSKGDVQCEADIFARDQECPARCPLAAEMSAKFCHFKCVKNHECGMLDTMPDNTIPDTKQKLCRHCDVEGCLKCVHAAPGDTNSKRVEKCQKCMPGYVMSEDGRECTSWVIWIFLAIAVTGALIVIGVLVWYADLVNRPIVNEEGLQYGLECRSRAKVRQPENTEPSENPDDMIGPRLPYPFDTNLCTTNVAGPGNMLFFRFQAATLIWAITLITAWIIMAVATDKDIFRLGLRRATTPMMMCEVIDWGRKLQLKYIYVKVWWLIFAYTFSFLGAIYYAVNSLRLFQTIDNEHTTMADYVAICRSLPVMRGDQAVEDCIKECVEKETGEKVIGVSVCWNFHDKVREVKEALEEDVGSLEHAKATNTRRGEGRADPDAARGIVHEEGEPAPGCFGGCLDSINNQVLDGWHCHFHEHEDVDEPEEKKSDKKAEEVREMLKGLENTEMAFVVFETEDSRDNALTKVKDRPVPLGDGGFFLEEELHEPESCCWEDFSVTEGEIAGRLTQGVVYMIISLCMWTFMLYAPYAHYMGSFSFANGDEPGQMSEGIFVGLVVGAQIGLFIVANKAAHHCGFCFEDDKFRIYILLYNTALIVNLILDMSLQAYLAYHQMSGRGVHTADGHLLSDLTSLQEILESYPMQKAIGNNLFKYCWPATFFVPFFAEPFAAQIGPYHIGSLFVRSNKRMVGENAEKALESSEAEQGRYADVMFNAILVCAVPFIAPGYMLTTFGALIFSHTFIYCYDHWRVLRCSTRFWFASDTVNTFSQKIFAVPCGMLAAGIVFKKNQQLGYEAGSTKLGSGPLQGPALWGTIAGVFFGHMIIHWLILDFLVPMLGRTDVINAKETYQDCAKTTPCSWFSSNPIHCLRSKYIFQDDPPQSFYVIGKEHLMKRNPKIHAWFEGEASKVEGHLGL